MHPARRLWLAVEPLHAVAYFHAAPTDALKALGLRGFWMSYFAGRFAPLGAIGPEVAGALAYGFAPSMVERSLPDAWTFASPEAVIDARVRSAASVLETTASAIPGLPASTDVEELADLAERAAGACDFGGRALGAGWSSVTPSSDPFARLWLAATVLREHRGDGHVAVAVSLGLAGLDTTTTLVATGALPREVIAPNRGWTDGEWEASAQRLSDRGVLDGVGQLTDAGRHLRRDLEHRTDELAAGPAAALGPEALDRLVELATPLNRALMGSGVIPLPNPIGLPRP